MSKHRGGKGGGSGKGRNDGNEGDGHDDNNQGDDFGQERGETPQEKRLRERVEADKSRQRQAHVAKCRQSVIHQLNNPTPEIYALTYAVGEVEKAEGSEGYFVKDPIVNQTIQEAMTANQNRPKAADAVHILSRRLQEIIHQENERDHKRRQVSDKMRSWYGNDKNGGMAR